MHICPVHAETGGNSGYFPKIISNFHLTIPVTITKAAALARQNR
jgi:hypothetical protein